MAVSFCNLNLFEHPERLIPLAERTGLVKQLSLWVLKRVLQQSSEWRKRGIDIGISINLSAQDLIDTDLPDVIAGLLANNNIPSGLLVLEITETSIMKDPERAMQILNRLHDMKVRISIDDFGTGYSSLSYLRQMPVSEIKIDRSFVIDMLKNPSDEAIVQATIGLAQNLGLEVVAEGVEDVDTLMRLRAMGCNLLQGYYISHPLTAEELPAWHEEKRDNFLPEKDLPA